MKPGFHILMIVIVVSTVVVTACGTSMSPAEPAQLPSATSMSSVEPVQVPTGIWEGVQEAGDTDWSMTLSFDGCASNNPCAKVYYILCAGEFVFQRDEKDEYVFQEHITEHADQCFSGSTVHVKYQGQNQPMTVSWLGEDGNVFTTATLRYLDPNANPIIEGLGQQVGLFHFEPGGYTNLNSFAVADGTLWIPDSGHGKILRYDIAMQKIVAEIQVGDPSRATYGDPQFVAVSDGSVWVTQCAEKKMARIDPATNQIVESIQLDIEPYGIAIEENTLWVTSFEPNQVLRVDAQTKQVVAIQDIDKPLGITVGGGALWVAEHREGNLVRIDPATNTVAERIQLPDGSTPENVIFFEDSIWVANNLGNSISRIDSQTKAQTVISLPGRSVNVSAGGGFIWVAIPPEKDAEINLSKYQIAKIDPASNLVVQVYDFPGASGSAYLDGVLWIVNRNDMSGDKLHGVKLIP